MRTTLDLPEELIKEALEISGFKSKTDVIIVTLQEYIKRKRLEELKGLCGKIDLDIDIDRSRGRPKKLSKK